MFCELLHLYINIKFKIIRLNLVEEHGSSIEQEIKVDYTEWTLNLSDFKFETIIKLKQDEKCYFSNATRNINHYFTSSSCCFQVHHANCYMDYDTVRPRIPGEIPTQVGGT